MIYRSYYTKLNDNSNNDDTSLWYVDPIIPNWMITVIMIIQVYDM